MSSVPDEKLEEARKLILGAFESAARKGKPPEMTSAVLKNRLLLAKQDFQEADYGATRFIEFLDLFKDILSVDTTQNPPLIKLQSPGEPFVPAGRVRRDLWTAMVDYRGGIRYLWDANQEVARRAGPAEDGSFLPTLTGEDFKALRRKFVEAEHPAPGSEEATRLDEWASRGLTNRALPVALQGKWNGTVKQEIARRLEKWFADHGLRLPRIFVEVPASRAEPRAKPPVRPVAGSLLQDFVLRCIAEMSDAQLAQLAIPADVAFRASNAR